MKMNLPNQLTIARIIITPFFLAALLWEALPHRFLIATAIYAVGAITDAVDGHLARKNGQVTNFGKLLDPIADKILTTSALLAFMTMGLCNIWIVMIVLAREFAVARWKFFLPSPIERIFPVGAGIWQAVSST